MGFGSAGASTFLDARNQQIQQSLAAAQQIMAQSKMDYQKQQDEAAATQQEFENDLRTRAQNDIEKRTADQLQWHKDQMAQIASDKAEALRATKEKNAFLEFDKSRQRGDTNGVAAQTPNLPPDFVQNFMQEGGRAGNAVNMQNAITQSPANFQSPLSSEASQPQQGFTPPALPPFGPLGGFMGGGFPSQTEQPAASDMAGLPHRLMGSMPMEPAGGTAQPFDFGAQQSPQFQEKQAEDKAKQEAASQRIANTATGLVVRMQAEARHSWIDGIKAPGLKAQADILQKKLEGLPAQTALMNRVHEAYINHVNNLESRAGVKTADELKVWQTRVGHQERDSLQKMDRESRLIGDQYDDARNKVAKNDRELKALQVDPKFETDPKLQAQAEVVLADRKIHAENATRLKAELDASDITRKQVRANLIKVGILDENGSPNLKVNAASAATVPDYDAPRAPAQPAVSGTPTADSVLQKFMHKRGR